MINLEYLLQKVHSAYKSEHASDSISPKFPRTGILLSVTKTFETRLIEKGILKIPNEGNFNPLWFLAETERNVYLWRNKQSLTNRDDYIFWLDINRLISKRLSQLENIDLQNPFLNNFGIAGADRVNVNNEREYYLRFQEIYNQSEPHLTALSWISMISFAYGAEEEKEFSDKKLVILPAFFKQH